MDIGVTAVIITEVAFGACQRRHALLATARIGDRQLMPANATFRILAHDLFQRIERWFQIGGVFRGQHRLRQTYPQQR